MCVIGDDSRLADSRCGSNYAVTHGETSVLTLQEPRLFGCLLIKGLNLQAASSEAEIAGLSLLFPHPLTCDPYGLADHYGWEYAFLAAYEFGQFS